MAFPEKAGPRPCLVEGCSARAATQTAIWVHFWHRHVQYTMVIMEEGNLHHPRSPLCNILVRWRSPNGSHKNIAQCKKGKKRKRRSLAEEEERVATSRAFRAYGRTLKIVPSLKYLGRLLLGADDDWPAVIRNLKKARAVWRRMTRILSREGARPRVSIFFFKVVVQSVLLFGAETWVVKPCTGRVMGGLQYQVARQLMGRLTRRSLGRICEYNSAEAAR